MELPLFDERKGLIPSVDLLLRVTRAGTHSLTGPFLHTHTNTNTRARTQTHAHAHIRIRASVWLKPGTWFKKRGSAQETEQWEFLREQVWNIYMPKTDQQNIVVTFSANCNSHIALRQNIEKLFPRYTRIMYDIFDYIFIELNSSRQHFVFVYLRLSSIPQTLHHRWRHVIKPGACKVKYERLSYS
jgi:hypothetical protein